MWRIEFKPAAQKQLAKLDPPIRARIAERINRLAEDPTPPGARRLQRPGAEHRVRVGNYRIIYTLDAGHLVVLVVKIGHRRDVHDS
jgi:mRNA interferase RelE/StbE